MVRCPECGAQMKYVKGYRVYLCQYCGFQGTMDEILRISEERSRKETDVKAEYLEWWLSKEKKKS